MEKDIFNNTNIEEYKDNLRQEFITQFKETMYGEYKNFLATEKQRFKTEKTENLQDQELKRVRIKNETNNAKLTSVTKQEIEQQAEKYANDKISTLKNFYFNVHEIISTRMLSETINKIINLKPNNQMMVTIDYDKTYEQNNKPAPSLSKQIENEFNKLPPEQKNLLPINFVQTIKEKYNSTLFQNIIDQSINSIAAKNLTEQKKEIGENLKKYILRVTKPKQSAVEKKPDTTEKENPQKTIDNRIEFIPSSNDQREIKGFWRHLKEYTTNNLTERNLSKIIKNPNSSKALELKNMAKQTKLEIFKQDVLNELKNDIDEPTYKSAQTQKYLNDRLNSISKVQTIDQINESQNSAKGNLEKKFDVLLKNVSKFLLENDPKYQANLEKKTIDKMANNQRGKIQKYLEMALRIVGVITILPAVGYAAKETILDKKHESTKQQK